MIPNSFLKNFPKISACPIFPGKVPPRVCVCWSEQTIHSKVTCSVRKMDDKTAPHVSK